MSAASCPFASPAGIAPPPVAIFASAAPAETCVMFGPTPPRAVRRMAARRRWPRTASRLASRRPSRSPTPTPPGSNGCVTATTTTTTLTAAPITSARITSCTPNSPQYQTADVSHSSTSSAATVPPSTGSAHDGCCLSRITSIFATNTP